MKKKIIITQLLYSIKKISSIYFLFTNMKKKLTKRKEKNEKSKNIKLEIFGGLARPNSVRSDCIAGLNNTF
jgi:hypothetical protein